MATQDHSTLIWIKGALDEVILSARRDLEDYIEGSGDTDAMVKCAEKLHQVRGTLHMIQLYGPAMLAEEMENTAAAFAEGRLVKSSEVAEPLMMAMIQLPDYLEKLHSGAQDIPLAILPLLNDLRSAREAPLLTDAALFNPILESASLPSHVVGQANPHLPAKVRRLRGTYHKALLSWYRDLKAQQGLQILIEVFAELAGSAGTPLVYGLFRSAQGVAAAVLAGGMDAGATVKQLIGKLDRDLKRLSESGEDGLKETEAEETVRHLLYYVARAGSDDDISRAVREEFDLDSALPSQERLLSLREQLSAPSMEMLKTVQEAIKTDLVQVKDSLDLYIRGTRDQTDGLIALESPLRRIGDTLGIIGQGDLRQRLLDQVDRIHRVRESGLPPEDAILMDIAANFLFVESSLINQAAGRDAVLGHADNVSAANKLGLPEGEMASLVDLTMREAKVDIAHAKEAISAYIKLPESLDQLAEVPARFRTIAGAFRILNQADTAVVFKSIADWMQSGGLSEAVLADQESQGALADAITSVEYYIEALMEGRSQGSRHRILDWARQALQRLQLRTTELEGLGQETLAVDQGLSTAVVEVAPTPEIPEVDPEILEIFIDEAKEEIGIIADRVPKWQTNIEDKEALITIRRSFHTLKGSGRLVGATLIGEFAWSIENMLNRVIDGTLMPTPELLNVLMFSVDVLPQLIDSLEAGQAPQLDVGPLMQEAFALATLVGVTTEEAKKALLPPTGVYQPYEAPPDAHLVSPTESPAEVVEAAEPIPVETLAHGEFGVPETKIGQEEVVDEEILDIFLEEANEELAVVQRLYPRWKSHPEDMEALKTFRRSFHTLKGSGRLVGAVEIGEFAWSIENMLNRVIDGSLGLSPHLYAIMDQALDVLPELIDCQSSKTLPKHDVQPLIDRAFALVRGEVAEPVRVGELRLEEEEAVGLGAAPEVVEAAEEVSGEAAALEYEIDPVLLEIFESESTSHLETLKNFVSGCRQFPATCILTERLSRAFHTLHGSSHMVGVQPMALVADAMERYILLLMSSGTPPTVGVVDLVDSAQALLSDLLMAVREGRRELPSTSELLDRVHQAVNTLAGLKPRDVATPLIEPILPSEAVGMGEEPVPPITESDLLLGGTVFQVSGDREMVDIFLDEAKDLLAELDDAIQEWRRDTGNAEVIAAMQRTLHTLKGGARLAGIQPIGDLSHAFESLLIGINSGRVSLGLEDIDLAQEVIDRIADQVEEVARQGQVHAAEDLVHKLETAKLDTGEKTLPVKVAPEVIDSEQVAVGGESDLVEIFLAEAADILESLDTSMQKLKGGEDLDLLNSMQRSLHTLKGGARLAGIEPIADLSHAFETLLIGLANQSVPYNQQVRRLAQEAADRLAAQVDEVSLGHVHRAEDLIHQVEEIKTQITAPVSPKGLPVGQRQVATAPSPVSELVRVKQEQIRVSAALLDRLVNNAGEVSIYRSRLEQQNTTIGFNVDELGQTVARLRTLLRQLEIETETQILYRWERDREFQDIHADFDPLEMDRFSTMQQLSRSLLETVNDLSNIKDVLGELRRETETLLLQQSRVSNDLQDGLLRTRMVPFAQVVPRLHRLVRQTSRALAKEAELEVYGADQELERNILERMVAPLEHLLRNAVAHGIESPAERRAQRKSEVGKITIHIGREATDVIITIADDGGGVRLDAVRKRAIERGLLAPHADVSDNDLVQFILAPGFSTVSEVSQIAGRGVGLDVVISELKQAGGSLEIESTPGRGSTFLIRLPLTLAISQALLIQVGDETYAIPFASIEGVVRLARADLEAHHEDGRLLEYAGNSYQVRYLGGILGISAMSFPEGRKWFPLLLVRSGDHRVALQVDNLVGNRQIVVKSVGPQLSAIRWITGGTILADGRVALILDVNALVRKEIERSWVRFKGEEQRVVEREVTVMVVDDSITVRKVTGRLLTRNNMSVITAKDGMDAVTMLQERIPDVMLLDIEMPRMDGFELARHMRNTPELSKIPIIMITSRTGEKHRQRAMELGIKRYLGKPYQESELLENIHSVLSEVNA